ncbi:protein of unknown function [Moritella yayanosii]|uniref:Uncharacterized protein n=1 Tax=Moritella yayanosii TaxID=69539 RepID=A0A330LUQ6_9GAMM|nr:protein of unknown function [Moritella yayanosii]
MALLIVITFSESDWAKSYGGDHSDNSYMLKNCFIGLFITIEAW